MSSSVVPLADRRESVAACTAALRELHTVLVQCPNSQVADLAGELGELAALATAQVVAVVAEAEHRGIIAESQYASTTGWVADRVWHCRRQAATIAKAAAVLRRTDLDSVAESMVQADVDVATANAIAAEYDKLAPDLRDEAKPVVVEQLLAVGAEHGPAGVYRLGQEILARYGADGEFEEHERRCRRQVELSTGRQVAAGLWDYGLVLDGEGRSVLEAVIGPLSAPQPDPDTPGEGGRDARSAAQRRGLALVEVLRRATQAAAQVPTSPKAVLTVTVDIDTLRAQVGGAGRVVGSVAGGTLLDCATVTKLACDAAVLPAALSPHGQIVALGRARRLFTTDQVRALWLRDQHCTFPRCEVPAAWTDAHHLVWWVHGGATDLDNAALLCGRHHTVVHRDRLAATLIDHHVVWDRRPGSYQPPLPTTTAAADGPPTAAASSAAASSAVPSRMWTAGDRVWTNRTRPRVGAAGTDAYRSQPTTKTTNPATARVRRT